MNSEKQSTNLQMTLREVNRVGEVKKNIPKLRFRGYEDAWEQRKFGNIIQIERGGSPRPIEEYITTSSDGLNWVKIGDAPNQGNYITSTSEKIRPEGLSKTREVYPGDLILSNSMSFGKPYIMAIKGCIHDGWLLLRDKNNYFDLIFLCNLLGTPQMLQQYKGLAAGSTVNNLNKELVSSTQVCIPNIEEQKTIGIFFETIDNLITLHQRKYDALKSMKKTLLSKMFPKNGEDVPEIRFKEFTDAWEQRKLGEEVQIVMGQSPKGENYTDNPEDYILVQGNADMKDGKVFPRVWTTQVTKQAHKGDIILSVRAPVGDIGKTDYDVVIGRGVAAVKGNEFFYQLLGKLKLDGYWTKSSTGSTFDSINSNEIKNAKVTIPDTNEQLFIGDYFQGLDNLITLHQRKLDGLKNMKKTLLQQMFV